MRFGIIPLIVLFTLFFSENLLAQSCGCAADDNCPVTISSGTSTTVCYEVSDAFANNLALPTQGVCGVEVNFTNSNIGQQVLTLCSPAGDCIDLTGSDAPCNIPTIFSNWNILFVPCDSMPHPDTLTNCDYPLVWDNCPDDCAWANAFYDGSYQPFGGCLEDFDFGPVNGQWCLTMDNTNNPNGGQIVDFEVIFCDDSGFLCCDADAGLLNFIPDVLACAGDSSLLLNNSPIYGATEPAPDEYGYVYLISQNNAIIAYEDSLNFIDYSAGTYEVCGLSYLYMDSLSLPAPNTGLNSTVLNDNLESASPLFCGDVSDNCFEITIAEPVPDQMISDTICESECYMLGDSCFTESGNYSLTLTSLNACDTLVLLQLTVLNVDTTNLIETICLGEEFTVGDSIYSATGIYETLVTSSQMCDSVVILDLTVLAPVETNLTETICSGETFAVGDSIYSVSGTYVDTIPSFAMCDSIVNLDLTVIDLAATISHDGEISCNNPSLILDGTGSSDEVGVQYLWTTTNGEFVGATNEINAEISTGGTYILTVLQGSCMVSDTVDILDDLAAPIANAGLPDTLNCAVSSLLLDASNSTPAVGNTLTYNWFTNDGCSIANSNNVMPTIECGGLFFVEVTNSENGCQDTASVLIMEDILPPIADAGQDTFLTCINNCIELNGSQSTPLANLDFSWTTSDGNIKNGAITATPQVDSAGIYQLIVTNNQNFCMDTATVNVAFDLVIPDIAITVSDLDTLTCQDTIITLNANLSNNIQNIDYQWIGDIETGQGTSTATVQNAGQYTLFVTDLDNGCFDSTSVTIFENVDYPEVEAEGLQGTVLNCINDTLPLGGNSNPIGSNFSYLWTTDDGVFFPSNTIQNPLTEIAGTYFLTITNLTTGCATTDSVEIESNQEFPIAEIESDGQINCIDTTFTLTALNPPGLNPWFYTWMANGEVLSEGLDSSTLTVNFPDTFYLQVTNVGGSFCEAFDTAIVILTVTPPTVDAGEDVFLDCENSTAMLSGSVMNPNLDLQWYGPTSSCILTNPNALNTTVECPGMYILEVTDDATSCMATDTVFALIDTTTCTPIVYAGADTTLNCYTNDLAEIAASGTMGQNYAYEWTNCAGEVQTVADVFNPIFSEGCYIFTITNTNFGFFASDTIEIFSDETPPIANTGPDLFFNCLQQDSCITVDVGMSSVGSEFIYEWGTVNGNFCSDSLALNVSIMGTGFYDLTVIDTTNGCVATDAMIVNPVGESPIAHAGMNLQLECGIDTIILNGNNSFIPDNTEICWFSNTGTILSGKNTLNPVVEGSGVTDTFFIVLINSENLCSDTAFVQIFAASGCFPTCGIMPPLPLTCDRDTVCLTPTIATSTGPDICYLWSPIVGTGGPIVGEDTLNTACVTVAGFYQLTVTKKTNGAQFSTSCQVQVMENISPPMVEAGNTQFLTCADTCVALNGMGSATNATYLWTTMNGNIKSGETTLQPLVNEQGTYTLTVTSLITGCISTDNVLVDGDFLTPQIFNIPTEVIGCSGQTVLNASATTSGVTYQWTTSNGNIVTGQTSPNPIITQPGEYCLTVEDISSGCSVTECTTVELDGDLPVANAGSDVFSTCLQTEFTLQGTSMGQNILTMEWTGPCIIGNPNTPNIMVDCPGIYTFTVTDNNGCQGSDNVAVVADNLPPTADAGANQTLTCDTLTVQLDATNSMSNSVNPNAGNLNFSWSNTNGGVCADVNSPTPTICAGGIYTVTVTDTTTGCTATDMVQVFEQINIPQINVSADTTLTCSRDTIELNGFGSSNNAPFTHLWQTADGNIKTDPTQLEVCVNQAGSYVLTVLDTMSGCEISDTVLVRLDTISPIAAIDTQEGLIINCATPTVVIDGSISTPLDSLTFFWETTDGNIISGNMNPTITVDSAGTYLLEVTNIRNGCTDIIVYEVEEDFEIPAVNFVPPPMITCAETEVQLEALPPDNQPIYEFMWTGPAGSISNPDTATPTVNQAVNYTVTITNETNGCTNSGSVLVEQNLVAPIAEATTIGSLDCIETIAGISGEGSSMGDFSYLWTTNSGGNIQNPITLNTETDAPGWYYLEVTDDENGCTATDSTQVTASAVPISGIFAEVDEPDCISNQGFIHLDSIGGGAGPYVYSIENKDFTTFSEFNYLFAGSYFIQIEDSNGCTFDSTFLLNPPTEVQVDLGLDLEVNFGDSTELEAILNIPMSEIDTVIWSPLPNPDCPLCLIQGIRPLETTTYSVQVIDHDGCKDSDKIIVYVDERPHLFAPNVFSPNGDGENEFFYLQTDETIVKIQHFLIFDRWDNLVFEGKDFSPNVPELGWNGYFMGKTMNPQVFVWKAEAEFADGRVEVFYGDFVLVR